MRGTTDGPRQGEIWTVRFDPTVGSEIQQDSPRTGGECGLRRPTTISAIVVPLTTLGGRRVHNALLIPIRAGRTNGLTQDSYADVFQIKSVSTARFLQRLGYVQVPELSEVMDGVALCLGWYDGRPWNEVRRLARPRWHPFGPVAPGRARG
jgi:mRNA interferase MazF